MRGGGAGVGDEDIPAPGEAWTPIRLTRWSGRYLEERGVENGRLDAELLLARVLGLRRLDLYLQFDRPLLDGELKEFKELFLRRASREPLQHVLGSTTFRELELKTDTRALVPRPETEVLVDVVLTWAREEGREEGRELTCLDVGTGSGAIVLSLLKEGPFCRGVATDPSEEALELARENAANLGLAERVELRRGRLFEPILPHERFDAVVSNPPYVPEGDRGSLEPEVRDWEPAGALFAGSEGLDVLRPLVEEASRFLRSGGFFAAEIGEGQGGEVAGLMECPGGFHDVRIIPDLTGKDRIVTGVAPKTDLKEVEGRSLEKGP